MNRGITLVEVLVVLTVITIATLISLPGCGGSHEVARRATCMNNQHELSQAILSYEAKHKHFPSMRNLLTYSDSAGKTTDFAVGWFPVLLPYLDRADLWERWKDNHQDARFLKVAYCPSDPPTSTGPTDSPSAYTMNGLVCRDVLNGSKNTSINPATTLPAVSLDYVTMHDGTATTLLLSENLRVDDYSASNINGWTEITMPRVKYDSTFGCPAPKGASGLYAAFCNTAYPYVAAMSPPNTSGSCLNLSSNHGGGVVAALCDGHVSFLRAELDTTTVSPDSALTLYNALATPDGAELLEDNADYK
jgi:prepilin-type N-terminal cleavage/methylation domain-containing protein/prepilin-type processing-associated H-X9-DG protein